MRARIYVYENKNMRTEVTVLRSYNSTEVIHQEGRTFLGNSIK